MMDTYSFKTSDRVSIKDRNITGTIIDIFERLDGLMMCTIESDDKTRTDDADAWNLNGIVLYTVKASDLVKNE